MRPAFLPIRSLPFISGPSTTPVVNSRRPIELSTPSDLSPHVQTLIQQQLQNPLFDVTKPPASLSSILLSAESSRSYITLSDLPEPATLDFQAAHCIHQYVDDAISIARGTVLREFPGIDKPGGGLYPPFRMDACWRDLKQFSRVVGYGVACGQEVFSEKGVNIMREIYTELNVPLDAMKRALQVISVEVSKQCEDSVGERVQEGYKRLIDVLETF